MKTYLLVLLLTVSLAAAALLSVNAQNSRRNLRHVVAFQFKESATAEQVAEVVDAFRALESKISEIRSFEAGTNISPEGLTKGFTHCFILTFSSAEDRDAYLIHPDHKGFGQLVGPVVSDVFVIDFWAE